MFSFPFARYLKDPFPHCVVKGAWEKPTLSMIRWELASQFQWSGEKQDPTKSINKKWLNEWRMFPRTVGNLMRFASDPPFLRWLEGVTGEKHLLTDPYLRGGGVHRIGRGGYLKMHTDFNYHEQLHLYRRLNVLLYLNEGWQDEWRGHLSLAGRKKVAPESNTMVVFTTDDASLHGHPEPLECPADVTRDSIALYYYSATRPTANFACERASTTYDP